MHVLLLLATACGPTGDIDRLDDQLEPVAALVTDGGGQVVDAETFESDPAMTTVQGEASDWTLTLGELTVALHSPTGVDLSALDGQTLAVHAGNDPWSTRFALYDDVDPVYIGAASYWPGVLDADLGEGVVSWARRRTSTVTGTPGWPWPSRPTRGWSSSSRVRWTS